MKPLLLIAAFLIMGTCCRANIMVYHVVGKAEIKEGKASHQAKLNSVLKPISELHLTESAEVVLRDNQNNYGIIKNAGRYSYSDVLGIINNQQSEGILKSVLSFLSAEAGKANPDIRDYAEHHMRKKGGVSRGGCTYPLMLSPGYGNKLFTDSITFKWAADSVANYYTLEIYKGDGFDNMGNILFRDTLNDTFAVVNIKAFVRNGKDSVFNWVVYPNVNANCARYAFYVHQTPLQAEKAKVLAKTSDIKAGDEKLLQQAILFEEAGLLQDAEIAYKELIEKYPKQVHKDLYTLFLARNGMFAGSN